MTLKCQLFHRVLSVVINKKGGKRMTQHLHILIVAGQWFATDSKGKWLTAQETAQAIATGATYEFV